MGCDQSKMRRLYMNDERKQSYIVQSQPSRATRPELIDEHKQVVRETWDIVKHDIAKVGVIAFMK